MHSSNDSLDRSVEIEAFGSPEHETKELPSLDFPSLDALTPFLRRVWGAPERWHRLPEYDLSVRALRSQGGHQTISFETRDIGSRNNVRTYRYDSTRGVLTWWDNDEIEHPRLPLHDRLPIEDPALSFPLAIVAFARARPEVHLTTLGYPGAPVVEHLDTPAAPSMPSPAQLVYADFLRRLTDQWFGPVAPDWGKAKQLLVALIGSGTFFVMLALFVLIKDPIWFKAILVESELFAPAYFSVLIIIALPGFFAWITSWGRQKPGPVRLYLSGFLLPYLIWTLLSLLDVSSLSGDGQSGPADSERTRNGALVE